MKEKIKNYTFHLKFLLIILLFVFLSACGGVTPGTDPPAINSFIADSYHITSGESVTLSWNVTGADSVTINQGIGTVASTGTKVVNPTATITYTLTATNTTDNVTSTVTINVGIIPEPDNYTVTFDSQGGSAVDPQMVEHGDLITEPPDPTRTGYTFGGWYKEAGCTNAWDFATDTVTATVTLYAKWTFNIGIIISYYTITFDSQGGSVVSSQMVEYGEKVTEPPDPTRTGYTFGGWYTESGCTNAWDFATDTVTSGMTLYAKWTSYALRDIGPAGGLIFYVKEGGYSDGWMYLEAASCDISSGISWGCYGTSIPGADGTAVGTGKQNTIDIVAECATVDIAAELSATLNWGGYSDWFLPSKDELNLMYVNLKVYGVGDFADAYYWSSSQYYPHFAQYAWTQYFSNGVQSSHKKNTSLRARAIRAF